jgi:hypothetical protein
MSKKTIPLEIDGDKYEISQPGGETVDQMLFRGGQALAAAVTSGKIGLTPEAMMGTMVGLIRYLSMEDFVWLRNEMKKVTMVGIVDKRGDGRVTMTALAPIYDDHFRGRSMAMMKWLKGALEAVFGDFFGELKALIAEASAAASRSPPPQAPAGSPGVSSSPPI